MRFRRALRRSLKTVNSMFRPLGVELRPIRKPVGGFSQFFPIVKRRGFAPVTVFDIGVGYGTWDLYEAFPDAKHVLIEALDDYRPSFDKIARLYDTDEHIVAVGDHEGEVEITVEESSLTASSTLPRSELTKRDARTSSRVVPLRSLDAICREHRYQGPYLIKIDVEGAEHAVLRGAESTLTGADMVIVEASIARRFVGGHGFFDLVSLMQERGFEVFDIIGYRYNKQGILVFVDLALVPENSPLRGGQPKDESAGRVAPPVASSLRRSVAAF